MSGIAGIVRFDGAPVTADDADRMVSRVAFRGPDSEGAWAEDHVAFAHRGYHVTPESLHEQQPLVAGPFALVADARVDGREELAEQLAPHLRELGGLGPSGSPTDAALLLAAYARWGEDCPEHVIGSYAFAVWDRRRQQVFCAVDAFGTRPFYYHHRPGALFAFGSASRTVAEYAPEGIDRAFLIDQLLVYLGDPARSPVRDTWGLLGGHSLTVNRDGLRMRKYFDAQPDPGVGAGWSDEDYVEGYRERFERAVRDRTRSAFPVAAQLSGGLDSSSIAAVARDVLAREGRGPLHTISSLYGHLVTDEREYIQAVVDQGGVVHHSTETGDLSPVAALDEMVPLVDDHLILGATYTTWHNFKTAAGAGARTIMTGFDGDTVVSHGYRRLTELAAAGDWATYARESEALKRRYGAASHLQEFQEFSTSIGGLFSAYGLAGLDVMAENRPPWVLARSLLRARREIGVNVLQVLPRLWRRALVPRPVLQAVRARQQAPLGPGHLSERAVALAREIADDPLVRERRELLKTTPRPARPPTILEEQQAGINHIATCGVSAHLAQLGGASGVDVAHPFLDRRLIGYSLALPSDLKLRDGWTRYVQRQAVTDVLPESVAWRVGKADFSPAFERSWFERDRERVLALLDEPGGAADLVDVEALRERSERAIGGSIHAVGGAAIGLTVIHYLNARKSNRDEDGAPPAAPVHRS